ncbi:hypothetical protein QYF61_009134 [Mycteria americana]|uniref:CDKAL methylthiotransferase n=1 Tax=Mycteria americana TaxID=33587 RepID=A0AAN7NJC2_MYCAM|nr:hypothetical protein QYF61_009134 [Mycteria americana]
MPAACDSVLEDIEDIVSAEDLKPHDRQFVRKNVFPKVRKRNSQKNIQTDDDPPSDSKFVDYAKLGEVVGRLETSAVVERDLNRLEKGLAETKCL